VGAETVRGMEEKEEVVGLLVRRDGESGEMSLAGLERGDPLVLVPSSPLEANEPLSATGVLGCQRSSLLPWPAPSA